MESKIQTGLASFGLSGQVFHAPFLEAHPQFKLNKVWERTKKRSAIQYPHAEIVRRHEEMVQDPDIELILVNTPDNTHYEFCKQAL